MRVGIDLQVLSHRPWTGVGNYAFNLTKALLKLETKHEFVLFVPRDLFPDPLPVPQAGLPHLERGQVILLPKKSIPFWSAHVTYARVMQKAKLDVLHGPANSVPLFYPSRPAATLPSSGEGSRVVLTIHDLAIYKHPEWFPRGQTFSTKFLAPRSIDRAALIIVPSHATKKDLIDLFKVAESKIAVIPEGVEERLFTPSPLSPPTGGEGKGGEKYILFVGTLEPRKNLTRLLEAYQSLPEDIRAEYDLVIAGGQGWRGESEKLKALSAKFGDKVRFLGYVSRGDLPALYQGASVFVYPSLYEGFGLPVLEAMAAGVPVVTSRGTAMEEIVHNAPFTPSYPFDLAQGRLKRGEGELLPAVLVDPYSSQDIGQAITKLIRDDAYASQISRAGEERARGFTWVKAARRTLEVYQAVS